MFHKTDGRFRVWIEYRDDRASKTVTIDTHANSITGRVPENIGSLVHIGAPDPSHLRGRSLCRLASTQPPNGDCNTSPGQNHTRRNDKAEDAALPSLLPLTPDPVIAVCV